MSKQTLLHVINNRPVAANSGRYNWRLTCRYETNMTKSKDMKIKKYEHIERDGRRRFKKWNDIFHLLDLLQKMKEI